MVDYFGLHQGSFHELLLHSLPKCPEQDGHTDPSHEQAVRTGISSVIVALERDTTLVVYPSHSGNPFKVTGTLEEQAVHVRTLMPWIKTFYKGRREGIRVVIPRGHAVIFHGLVCHAGAGSDSGGDTRLFFMTAEPEYDVDDVFPCF